MTRRSKLSIALITLLIGIFSTVDNARANYWTQVSGHGTGIDSYNISGWGITSLSHEDTGYYDGTDYDQILVNKTWANVATGRMGGGLWGTAIVNPSAPQRRPGPYGTADTRIIDIFTIGPGTSGLQNGEPVQILFFAEINGWFKLLGNPSGGSSTSYRAQLWRPPSILEELDYDTGGLYPPQDFLVHDQLLKVVNVNIGDVLKIDAKMDNTMNGSAHDPGATETNYLDIMPSGIARLGYAPGYENIEIISDANAPIEIPKPDLVITDIWNDGGVIYYQIMNDSIVSCAAGHTSSLVVNGIIVDFDIINFIMVPGQRENRSFSTYYWSCTPIDDTLVVIADNQGIIDEADEQNNSRTERWLCDNNEPEITSGPTVSNITTESAKISWITDEDSNSLVLYNTHADVLSESMADQSLNIEHEIILNNLMPGTTYIFSVSSTDDSNNTVTSGPHYLTTQPLSDGIDPNITFFAAASSRFPMQFSAEADDNIDVDRVEFMIDGNLFEIDYSAPYMCILDPGRLGYTRSEFEGNHVVAASVIDRFGNTTGVMAAAPYDFDCNRPTCDIIEPEYGVTIDTDTDFAPDINIPVDACATEFAGWTMGRARDWHGDGVFFQTTAPVYKVDFIYDGEIFDTTYGADVGEIHSSEFDANGLGLGTHTVWVRAMTNEGCTSSDTMRVTVRRRRPQVRIASRTVTTTGTCLNVSLRLENTGDDTAYLDSLTDTLIGFQTVHANNPAFDAVGEYSPDDRLCTTQIVFDPCVAVIAPDASYVVTYLVVPVLYPGIEEYEIGLEARLGYHDNSESYTSNSHAACTWVNPHSGRMRLEEAVTECLAIADYLVVTNPENLYDLYDTNDVHLLLSKAADLASLRVGVLAYYYSIGNTTTNYDRNDRIAIGHLFSDYRQELWLADNEDDRVRSYHSGGQNWINDGNLPHTVGGLHENDGFAVGNVYGFTYGGTPDPENEFVVADGHSPSWSSLGRVSYYQYNSAIKEFSDYGFNTDYEAGDGFAVGNVLLDTIADEDEVLIANADGTVQIHQSRSSWPEMSIPTIFESGDIFFTADILGDFLHEIVIGHKADDTVYIYDGNDPAGIILETFVMSDLNSDDDIAAGDLTGDLKHEIVFADASADEIGVYTYDSSSHSMTRTEVFSIEYYNRDALAVADFTHALRSEILILRGQNDHMRRTGQLEIISLEGGDNPGDKWALDDLMDEGGEWADKLHPDWASEGYLLIIGETQIIPAFTETHDLGATGTKRIEASDTSYANTAGEAKYPELCIGRIIGNNAARLIKPIQTSLDILRGDKDFSNNFGFSASGHARGMSGESDEIDFTPERRSVAGKLRDNGFTVSEAHEPDVTEFFAQANGRNAIYFGGHGSTWGWDDVNNADVDNNFDTFGLAPLVFGASCLTGRYIGGYSLAESFLNNDASSYIGATENGYGPHVFWLASRFFDRFYVGRQIGHALKYAKRTLQGAGRYSWDRPVERYNASVFHLFGDPKLTLNTYTASSSASTSSKMLLTAGSPLTGPVSSLQINVPNYDVDSSGGYDYVRIPDGDALLVPDMPEVPTYTVTIDFPPGYKVQDVTMTECGAETSGVGLNLPIVDLAVRQQQGGTQGQQPPSGPDWYPDRAFDWETISEPNDHTCLVVTVYPFYYNSKTTQHMFYQSYDFDIDYITSDVTIKSLRCDKNTYSPGDTATIGAYLLNSSQQPANIIAEAIITTASGKPVYGWPIRLLKNVQGLASCSWSADTNDTDPNEYIASLTLKDPTGTVLDSASCNFRIGRALAQITNHSVNPECFTADNNVIISSTLTNTGDIPLTGTLYVEVQRTDGSLATQYTKDFNDVPNNGTVSSNIVWWATLPRGECTIIAYAIYDGQATPVSVFPEVTLNSSGDLNDDGTVNFIDYSILAGFWNQFNTTADIAPDGGDCYTDHIDLAALGSYWLQKE
ncbi:MAG: C25 family cysteine peptidase [Planctomycetota bacterium]